MHIVVTHRMQLCLSCPSYGQSFFFSLFLLLRMCVHINSITLIHFLLVMQYTNMLLTLRIQRKKKRKKKGIKKKKKMKFLLHFHQSTSF